jgi:penicillin-binding protein 2
VQGQYPPASTYKPIHAAAALEEGVITPETKIFSGPSFWFAGRAYRDWKEEGHGSINVHRAIVESSDTFFYQVG